jgi:hypothetical protein
MIEELATNLKKQSSSKNAGQGFLDLLRGTYLGAAIAGLRPSLKTALLALISAAYLLPLVWILYRVGDEGALIYGAQRASLGELPGRDFVEAIGPGSFYWLGLFFRLFGFAWTVTRMVVLGTGVATAAMLYAIARQVCRESVAFLVWLFVVVVSIPIWPAVNHHWDSNLFAVLAIWCFLKLEKTSHWAWAIASGILVGLTACVIQQKGILLFLALVASDVVRRTIRQGGASASPEGSPGEKRVKWWLFPAGFAAVGFAVLALYFKAGALADFYFANVTWPLSSYHSINALPYGYMLLPVAIGPAFQVLGAGRPFAGLLCTGLSLIPFLSMAFLPLAAAGSLGAFFFAAERRREWFEGPLMTLTLAGVAMWLSESHRRDIFHLVYGAPILLIVWFAIAQRMLKAVHRIAFMVALAAGLTVFGVLNFFSHVRGSHPVETRRGTIRSVSDDEALKFLCTSVKQHEFVFVYPYYASYYYLADVTNPTRISILLYGYNTPEQFDEVIGNLEEKRVPYVLWDQEVYGEKLRQWFPEYKHPAEDKRKLEHYILAHYDQLSVKSGFRIFKRRRPGVLSPQALE